MSASKLDAVYRSFLITKFFTKGWGKPENLKRLFEFRKVVSDRNECYKLVERDYPVTITKEQKLSDCRLLEGYFLSPLERYLPGIVPEVARKAHFQALIPLNWPDEKCKPMCLHLAGTGDHFFWRRRNLMVRPLLKEAGIGGIILENPFYGLRKPTDQIRSSLHNVSDIFVMGGCLILESLVLFHWCERNGLGPLGVTGLSMGGHMASLAATNWPKPLVLVPCLSWSTASAVFLQGVMSQSINWDLLEDQYLSDGVYREKLSKMVTVVDEAFLAGKKFAKTMSENMNETNRVSDTSVDKTENGEVKKVDITYDEVRNQTKSEKGKETSVTNNEKKADGVEVKVTQTVESNKDHNKQFKVNESSVTDNKNETEVTQSVESNKNNVTDNKSDLEMDSIVEELKILLNEEKISGELFEKLTGNEKFELDLKDIDELNNINEDRIKACVAIKLKMGNVKRQSYNTSIPIDSALKELKSKPEVIVKTEPKLKVRKFPKWSWNMSEISEVLNNLPFLRSKVEKKIDINKIHWRDREALQFMRGIMDECTHLSNFSVPFDTSLIIAVCAKHDAYVPRDDVGRLEEIWPGAEVRYLDAGHVSAYILHQSLFRGCIIEAFERSKKKWQDGRHIED